MRAYFWPWLVLSLADVVKLLELGRLMLFHTKVKNCWELLIAF